LSAALLEWKAIQESFKGRRILASGGIAFAGSQFVFAGYAGAPFSKRAFNLRLRAAYRALGVGNYRPRTTPLGDDDPLNHVGKDLREIQELLRHKNIRTTVRYTHVRADPADRRGTESGFGVRGWKVSTEKRSSTFEGTKA
jgi:site-specific recombinase XerC